MQFETNVGFQTDVGKERELNEDSLLVLTLSELEETGIDGFFAIADGMGGHSAGDVASAYIIKTLQSAISREGYGRWTESLEVTQDDLSTVMRQVIEEANAKLHQTAIEDKIADGMGTTVTAAGLIGQTLHIAHVGDTRAYLIRDNQVSQLTQDHSWVAELAAQGLMSSEQAEIHPNKHILTRAVGTDPVVKVDVCTTDIITDDIVLLCSDGLCGLISDTEMLTTVLEDPVAPQKACDELTQLANVRGGHDNITVIVVRFGNVMALEENVVGAPIDLKTHDTHNKREADLLQFRVRAKGESPFRGLWSSLIDSYFVAKKLWYRRGRGSDR